MGYEINPLTLETNLYMIVLLLKIYCVKKLECSVLRKLTDIIGLFDTI